MEDQSDREVEAAASMWSTAETQILDNRNNNTQQAEESLPKPPPPSYKQSPTNSTRNTVFARNSASLSSPKSPTKIIQEQNTSTKRSSVTSPQKNIKAPMIPVENDFEIEQGTPAAEALKANADVKVTKVAKAARYLHINAVRRNAKKILHVGSGVKRGKPPRVPNMDNDSSQPRLSDGEDFLKESKYLDVLVESIHENEDDGHSLEVVSLDEPNVNSNQPGNKSLATGGIEILKPKFEEEDTAVASLRVENSSRVGTISQLDIKSVSSYSSDEGVPTKIAVLEQQPSLMLLDTKGKKQEVILNRKMKRKLKKREKKKKKRSYVKGKKIDGQHELYTLSIAMMLGLRYSIFLTNNQIVEDRRNNHMWLDSDEFMKVEKYIFRPDGRDNTPPHQLNHTFKFKDYSPIPFAFIRRMFGINEYEYHHSVCGNANFIEFISNAKSGQFFFYSSDGKYMIKTMTNAESKFLRRILPHYFKHCAQNPNTILTKFLGMYRVKLYHLRRSVKFVIMNSVFDTDKMLSSFFDLKGSVIGRNAKPNESVQKDNDLRKNIASSAIRLPDQVRERLRDQVKRDCDFLKNMKIMDYSMLVGIHYIPVKNSKTTDINGLTFRGPRKPRQKVERSRSDPAVGKGTSAASPQLSPAIVEKCINSSHHSRSLSDATYNFNTGTISPTKKEADETRTLRASLPGKMPALPNLSPVEQKHDNSSIISFTSNMSFGYDEDDENSHLELPREPSYLKSPTNMSSFDKHFIEERERIDRRREKAIEQNYWPFHRHYELNGDRRIVPMKAKVVRTDDTNDVGARYDNENTVCTNCFGDPSSFDPNLQESREKLTLYDFSPPITSRKDGGLMMDLSSVHLPMRVTTGGKTLECEGKIYYMGIIDILQQFNVRKRIEARYRKIKGGEIGASCVHPDVYADRFVEFFDEYTLAHGLPNRYTVGEQESGTEEVVFRRSKGSNLS